MAVFVLCGILLLALIAGLLLCSISHDSTLQETGMLAPFCILPVGSAAPSVRAFLERYAAQTAWMDTSVLHSVILVHPDDDAETADMCMEIAGQYDFFSCMSLSEVKEFLAVRMDAVKKIS